MFKIKNYIKEVLLFFILGILIWICFYLEKPIVLLFIPFSFVIPYILKKWDSIYYIAFLTIPLSISLDITGSLTLDFVSEPILMVLTLIFVLYFFLKPTLNTSNFLLHPLTILFITQLLYWGINVFYSIEPILSLKFLLAKLWFILPAYFLSNYLISKISDINKALYLFCVGTIIMTTFTLFKHYKMGFTFDSINNAVQPFSRNHVNFSTLIVFTLPFMFYLRKTESKTYKKILINYGIAISILGIALSYTRTSWIALIIIFFFYFIIKLKLLKPTLLFGFIGVIATSGYLINKNKYIDFAPDYKSTIFHKGDFKGHLKATYNLKDVSGMERVYRWVAATNMIKDKPLLGHGTNTFYPTYMHYTEGLFKTYVSDNPEHSTTHNYFLMVLSEQGIIGLTLFLLSIVVFFLKSDNLFFKIEDSNQKRLVLFTILSMISFMVHLILNDLVEVDKFALLFFFEFFIIYKVETWQKPIITQPKQEKIN